MNKNQRRNQVEAAGRVVLTTEYEVDLAAPDGLEHLFNAMIGETTSRLSGTKEFSQRGWPLVHDACLLEIHYVAGQLKRAGSRKMDIPFLLEQFAVAWDRVAERLNEGADINKE